MFVTDARLRSRRQVSVDMWVLGFEAPEIGTAALAGQFVNIGLRRGPLLRRPFSVYGGGDAVEILVRGVGVGTDALLSMRESECASLLGPLGRAFEIVPGTEVVLVSGGLGAAPMALAARQAERLGCRVTWAHGARTAAALCIEWHGHQLLQATDDGSAGRHGSVLDLVPPGSSAQVLACGPNPMLREVAERWPDAQVAIETYMGCGTGVCLGCAVPLRAGGYDRACREGPVYRAGDVDWVSLPGHLHYAAAR